MAIISPTVSKIISARSVQFSLFGLLTLYFIQKLRDQRKRRKVVASLEAASAVARRERDESIQWAKEQSRLVSDDEREKISKMNFRQLRESLQRGDISAESVMRVYYGLAVRSHEKTNCLTVISKESLDIARSLDQKAKDNSYKKGPFFGIPISVKDSIDVEGWRNTWGCASKVDHRCEHDSLPIMKLKEAGMIPFCQTNVPTSCMTSNCCNSVYGTTSTPLNPSRTSGGSSGGEGALIGSHGSIIGMGSDIGGSIRIPSAYSGCCGFKPSSTRFSMYRYHEPIPCRPILMPTEGPLAQDPHTIVDVLRNVWSDKSISSHDPLSVPVDFREELFKEGRKYRIGYFTSDGYIDPLPGNQRVVREAVEMLREKGHTLVPFSMEDIVSETAKGVFGVCYADGGQRQTEMLQNEPLPDIMKPMRDAGLIPMWKKRLVGWIAKWRGDSTLSDCLLSLAQTPMDVQVGIDRVCINRKRMVKKMNDESIDCILCPTTIAPAVPHSVPNELPFTAIMATMFWNAMDFPAGVVTIGAWTEKDENELEKYEEKGLVEKTIKRGCKNSVGLPLSVQFVAPPFRDEIALRLMCDIFDAKRK